MGARRKAEMAETDKALKILFDIDRIFRSEENSLLEKNGLSDEPALAG
jgi:hypothetical protein